MIIKNGDISMTSSHQYQKSAKNTSITADILRGVRDTKNYNKQNSSGQKEGQTSYSDANFGFLTYLNQYSVNSSEYCSSYSKNATGNNSCIGNPSTNKDDVGVDNLTNGNQIKEEQPQAVSDITSQNASTPQDLRLKFQVLNYLMKIFFANKIAGQNVDLGQKLSDYMSSTPTTFNSSMNSFTYSETESMTFQTEGTVLTGDGKELSFNVNMQMSRSFYQEYVEQYQVEQNPLMDPLVLQLDDNMTSVTDQNFYFDLDSDGVKDQVANISSGSGFLALDKNEDGTINDGSELFGTKTGNGFQDLSQYDLDKNGWIDEADDIYNKLRIMTVNSDGTTQVYSLKEKDVGAICLQNISSQFAMTNSSNETNGMLRSTGVYLRESGEAKVIQQIDLAKKGA